MKVSGLRASHRSGKGKNQRVGGVRVSEKSPCFRGKKRRDLEKRKRGCRGELKARRGRWGGGVQSWNKFGLKAKLGKRGSGKKPKKEGDIKKGYWGRC